MGHDNATWPQKILNENLNPGLIFRAEPLKSDSPYSLTFVNDHY